PDVATGVDHRRRPERPLGLPAGGGIGAGLAIVEAEPVAVAVTEARDGAGEVAARLGRERRLLAVPEHDRDAPRHRCPDPGVGASARGLDPHRPAIEGARRMRIERIALSDALYHDVEHTVMVTLVGTAILRGREIAERLTPGDWLHMTVALLCHDVGYVRGACRGDTATEVVV